MLKIKAYLDRIRGRLTVAFGVLMIGTVVTWWSGAASLARLTDELTGQLDRLQASTGLGARLESQILAQIAAGERYLVTGARAAGEEFARLGANAHQLRRQFAGLPGLNASERVQVERIDALHARLEVDYSLAHALRDLGRADAAVRRTAAAQSVVDELTDGIRTLAAAQAARIGEATGALQASANRRQYLLIFALAGTALVATLFLWRTLESIDRPLARLTAAADRLGNGELNVDVGGKMPGELAVLAGAFVGMADRLRTIVAETVTTAEQIGASASDLSSLSEEVAASSGEVSTAMVGITTGAEDQVEGLRSVDEALARVRERAADISAATGQVRELTGQISELAAAKREDIGRALRMLREVREVVETSSREVTELAEAYDQIDTFVETIQGIARQTNLLALNAAIEAARAGDYGRGFAVVADEVRKLADESAEAAERVARTVRQVRKEVEEVVAIMATGTNRTADVAEASRGAEAAFEEIIAAVAEVRAAAERVAAAAEGNTEILAEVENTVHAVAVTAESHAASAEEVSAAAQEQSAATEEMSAAAVQLLTAAERLKELVSGFRL